MDVVDQLARKFSIKSSSRRWPFLTWCHVQELAGINVYALYKALTKDNISRRDFIFKLAEELVRPFIDSRTEVTADK